MATIRSIKCDYCPKKFYNVRGLNAHLKKSLSCGSKQFSARNSHDVGYRTADQYLTLTSIGSSKRRKHTHAPGDTSRNSNNTLPQFAPDLGEDDQDSQSSTHESDSNFPQSFESDNDDAPSQVNTVQATQKIVDDFKTYAALAINSEYDDFTDLQVSAIDLLHNLRQTKASLGTYEAMMKWHLRSLKRQGFRGNFSKKTIINREKLYDMLYRRYNIYDDCCNIIHHVNLPYSRAQAKIITNSVEWCLQSLLTDPRISDDDYLFHNNNPLSPPPNRIDTVSDINTGEAYIKSYSKYIKDSSKEILLPIICYIDGAATGQFVDLPITPFKFTLGIFNRKAREKLHTWRTLGYVPAYSADKASGRRTLYESGHVDSVIRGEAAMGEGNVAAATAPKAQDLHTILEKILEGFVKIQSTGFVWDLMYRGKLYKGIKFIPYIHFIVCDTEEADRLVGKYTARTKGVKQLCRYCCCPTSKTNQPRAEYDRKTVPMISNLIENKDVDGLKDLSQQLINNACYKLRFGAHNEEGVHGSCPVEMLHCLHLGIFKYVRDCFFAQIGSTSKAVDKINGLASAYGSLFKRQSQRSMPKTRCSNG